VAGECAAKAIDLAAEGASAAQISETADRQNG
jgi:hypothetical protein